MKIEGKIAVVTGAGSGLGEAAVRMLVAGGAKVVMMDANEAALQRLSGDDALAGRVMAQALDVCDEDAMNRAFAHVETTWARPRILVTCAGILQPARVIRIDKDTGLARPRELEMFRRVLEINLIGAFNPLRLFAAGLADAGPLDDDEERGVIVNTASVAAYEALSAQAAYGSSKAGVAAMTLPLARELARYGIRVMTVAPGTFRTGMYDVVPPHTRDQLIEDVPFPTRPGRPDEFAHLVRALIENAMMNGSVVRIDGAVRMREPLTRGGEAAGA